ncbi:Hypothetical protein SMAX5B_003573 [Scophthalmus maximus]|uniref:Uncharacterized protein n=1 Tax=Scophthalmus maximus TaxID=52904 RepID=A0A2U9AX88_SCOMX|nr:Hypothetical protein SMAX5B_003573 [Scophthalmus maximus]
MSRVSTTALEGDLSSKRLVLFRGKHLSVTQPMQQGSAIEVVGVGGTTVFLF